MDNFKKIMVESDDYNIATTIFGLLSNNVAFAAAMYLARKVDTVYTSNEQIKSDILDIEFDLMNDQDITEEELQEYKDFCNKFDIDNIEEFIQELCEDVE